MKLKNSNSTYRYFLLSIFALFGFTYAKAQTKKDTITVEVSIYPFAYDIKFKTGSVAMGPSLIVNSSRKLSIQLGVLYDFKRYVYRDFDHFGGYTIIRGWNLFVPLLFHYRYYMNNKTNCFFTAGMVLGENYYVNEYGGVGATASFINLVWGTGISYNISKRWQIKALLTTRYKKGIFSPSPGLLSGVLFSFPYSVQNQ